jgi:hypothetical protein
MGKVQKLSNPKHNIPSAEPFRMDRLRLFGNRALSIIFGPERGSNRKL